MEVAMRKLAARFLKDESGSVATEYAILVALIALVAVTGVKLTDLSLDKLATELAAKRMEAGVQVAAEPREEPIITGSIKRHDQ